MAAFILFLLLSAEAINPGSSLTPTTNPSWPSPYGHFHCKQFLTSLYNKDRSHMIIVASQESQLAILDYIFCFFSATEWKFLKTKGPIIPQELSKSVLVVAALIINFCGIDWGKICVGPSGDFGDFLMHSFLDQGTG